MDMDIVIRNYRCFSIEEPARITITDGFTSFIGVNNSGKSALLKFFYEFQELFNNLSFPQRFSNLLKRKQGFNLSYPYTVKDKQEVFNNKNEHNITLEFYFSAPIINMDAETYDFMLEIQIERTNSHYKGRLFDVSTKKKQIIEKIEITDHLIL